MNQGGQFRHTPMTGGNNNPAAKGVSPVPDIANVVNVPTAHPGDSVFGVKQRNPVPPGYDPNQPNPAQASALYNNNNESGIAPTNYGEVSGAFPVNYPAQQQYNQPSNSYPYPGASYNPETYNQTYMQAPKMPQISDMQPGAAPMVPTGDPSQVPINGRLPVQGSIAPTPQPTPPTYGTIDYLNYIAPESAGRKTSPMNSKFFVVIGSAVIILVIVISILGAVGNTQTTPAAKALALGTDIANLESIVEYGKNNSDFSSALDRVNAETGIITISEKYSLSQVLTLGAGENGEAADATADETVTEDLDKAKANGQLDKKFSEVLGERIETVKTSLQDVYNSTKNAEVKSALEDAYNQYDELSTRLKASQSNS